MTQPAHRRQTQRPNTKGRFLYHIANAGKKVFITIEQQKKGLLYEITKPHFAGNLALFPTNIRFGMSGAVTPLLKEIPSQIQR